MVKKVSIVEKVHRANDQLAEEIRKRLDNSSLFSLNIMASPGAGKTSLIERTLLELNPFHKIAVIDGDVATSIDADRAANAGATAVQINTGGQCHIDANMLQNAINTLDLDSFDLLLVENVGNLICPASFQLGTNHPHAILGVQHENPTIAGKARRAGEDRALNGDDSLPQRSH